MKPPKDQLEDWYTTQRKSARQIATLCGVSHMSVKRWLREYGIERRPAGRGLANRGIEPPSREDLYRLVHFEHQSLAAIGANYGVDETAVAYWLDRLDIPRPTIWSTRRKGRTPALPTEVELRGLCEQGISLREIARRHSVSDSTIGRLCRKYGIEASPDGWQGIRLTCDDGHQVRSTYEQRVDNWLHVRGIPHEYEPALPCDRRYHADFLANGWYVEIWGVKGMRTYAARKRRKLALYRLHGLPLVHLTYDAFSTRHNSWERRITPLLSPAFPTQTASEKSASQQHLPLE